MYLSCLFVWCGEACDRKLATASQSPAEKRPANAQWKALAEDLAILEMDSGKFMPLLVRQSRGSANALPRIEPGPRKEADSQTPSPGKGDLLSRPFSCLHV